MSTRVTLEMIFEEIVTKGLPEATLSKEKLREIQHSIQEMKKGNYVTLEELKGA